MTKEGAWARIGGSRGKLCGSDTVRVRGFVDLGQMTNSSLKRGMKRPGLSEENPLWRWSPFVEKASTARLGRIDIETWRIQALA